MIQRRLFKKKNKKFTLIIILLLLIFFLIIYSFFFKIYKQWQQRISPNIKSFYSVPNNKEGQNIPNQDKKGLHLSYSNNNSFDIIKNKELKYSIQVFVNNDYKLVNKVRNDLLNKKESIFITEDFSLAIFNSNLGKEYFLLYKNFEKRIEAREFCENYTFFLDNCLIVNVQNLD